jgi:hypothetical protein
MENVSGRNKNASPRKSGKTMNHNHTPTKVSLKEGLNSACVKTYPVAGHSGSKDGKY